MDEWQDQLPGMESGQWEAAEGLHIMLEEKESGEEGATKVPH